MEGWYRVGFLKGSLWLQIGWVERVRMDTERDMVEDKARNETAVRVRKSGKRRETPEPWSVFKRRGMESKGFWTGKTFLRPGGN